MLPFPIGHFILAPEQNTFATVHVDLTHRCNMECANCYVPNRDIPDMDSRRLFEALAKLPKRTDIRLMGGEPTLRLDLPEIIREVVRHGHRPVLATNGLKLAHLDYCCELKDAGLLLQPGGQADIWLGRAFFVDAASKASREHGQDSPYPEM